MKNRKLNVWRSLRGSLLLVSCSLVVSAGSSSGGLVRKLTEIAAEERSVKLEPSVVVSDGLKLEIVALKHLPNDVVEVTMRNGYRKDITAIAATVGDSQSFRRDYIYAESEANQKLSAGATDLFLYTPSRLLGVLPQIVVSAVVFSDGTKKGDGAEVSYILDKRRGMKIQLNRINPSLQKLGNVQSSRIRPELRKLRGIVGALSVDEADGSSMSPGLEYGLIHGRAFILNYLSKLETVLENERIESFYQNGVRQTVRHGGEEDFRSSLPRIQMDFKALAGRL
jgi:hypothetical protein